MAESNIESGVSMRMGGNEGASSGPQVDTSSSPQVDATGIMPRNDSFSAMPKTDANGIPIGSGRIGRKDLSDDVDFADENQVESRGSLGKIGSRIISAHDAREDMKKSPEEIKFEYVIETAKMMHENGGSLQANSADDAEKARERMEKYEQYKEELDISDIDISAKDGVEAITVTKDDGTVTTMNSSSEDEINKAHDKEANAIESSSKKIEKSEENKESVIDRIKDRFGNAFDELKDKMEERQEEKPDLKSRFSDITNSIGDAFDKMFDKDDDYGPMND